MAVITIPDALRERLGEEATRAFVDVIKEVDSESKKELATRADLKEEVYKINERISKLDERITIEAIKTNERITSEISKVNERITSEISKLRNDNEKSFKENIKWMFIFWIGQIAVIITILKLFFK
ncbi:MAG: hypothetical protein HQL01_14425 [Nitrospirae bacterium]|nr:hypothetical protein [Nitrospirota bacterium]